MATQTISANRHNNRHDASGTALPYVAQPGSPTLTNPDMILPDYDDPDTDHDQARLPPSMWNSGHSIEHGFQFSQSGFYSTPNPLSTPIIYGNGTMLSDIGEVTEVESTVGPMLSRNASRRSGRSSDDDTPLRLSPTKGNMLVQKRSQYIRRERRLSVESTSTINTQDGNGAFVDFDDSASVGGDSNFQGDDEESLASSYVEDTPISQNLRSVGKSSVQRLSVDSATANSISRRAEQILATAKLKLTNMENNLTRARTLSYSSVSDGSTPSPPFGGPATSLRGPAPSSIPTSHSRNMSENAVAGASRLSGYPERSASALGAAGGYRRPLPTSRSMDALGSASARGAYPFSHHIDTALEPLSEDDDAFNAHNWRDKLVSPTSSIYSDAGLARSTSVRDIQDQMQGLKGKISSLREQARADSMKRRSLQSLRTPSPFTHARWDQGFVEPRNAHNTDEHGTALAEQTNENKPGSGGDYEREKIEYITDVSEEEDGSIVGGVDLETREIQEPYGQGAVLSVQEASDLLRAESRESYDNDDVDDSRRENRHALDPEEDEANDQVIPEDYESESGESLYHETSQHQISHEDREDAFDYERFFLHSAMSTMSRHRSESVSSNDSAETTRGPIVPRQRRGSVDTVASAETFATAAEGPATRNSTAQGVYRVYTPADLFEDTKDENDTSTGGSQGSNSNGTAYSSDHRQRQNSVVHRPVSTSSVSTFHRPSCSSFESTGTHRSFPLINKAKLNGGILTPGGSPDHGLKQVTNSPMNDAASSIYDDNNDGRGQSPGIQLLSKKDQSSVERLVASLGKCVLALGEANGAQIGGHDLFRRRIEAARRILEGEGERP